MPRTSEPAHADRAGRQPGPPDLDRLLALLKPHDKHRLKARGCPADISVGMYLELMTINESAPPLKGGCSDGRDPAYWKCHIEGRALSVESGDLVLRHLQLRVRKADEQPDLASVTCGD